MPGNGYRVSNKSEEREGEKMSIRFSLIIMMLVTVGLMGYEYNLNLNEVDFEQETKGTNEYDALSFPESSSFGKIGSPDLPAKYINLIIPEGSRVADIILTSDLEEVNGNYNLLPVQDFNNENVFINPDAAVYQSEELYPQKVIKAISHEYFAGANRIVTLRISPFQYQPKTGKMFFHNNISFNLRTTNFSDDGIIRQKYKLAKDAEIIKNMLKEAVYNPEEVNSSMYQPQIISRNQAEEMNIPNYLILMPQNYLDSGVFDEFIKWKREKGNIVETVSYESIPGSIDDIGNNDIDYPNDNSIDDKAAHIRKYLADKYTNSAATYLLLVGGEKHPHRIGHLDTNIVMDHEHWQTYGKWGSSDLYFSEFQGDWNVDGDINFGEPFFDSSNIFYDNIHFFAEIFTGRVILPKITVSNRNESLQQAKNWIHKTITYETDPGFGDNKYLLNAYHSSSDNNWMFEDFFANEDWAVLNFLKGNGFSTTSSNDDGYGTHPKGADVINKMKAKGITMFSGHGGKSNFQVATQNRNNDDNSSESALVGSDNPSYRIRALDEYLGDWEYSERGNAFSTLNVDYKYQLHWSGSCEPAAFHRLDDQISMARAFTTATPIGYCGPLFIGSSTKTNKRPEAYLRGKCFENILGTGIISKKNIGSAFFNINGLNFAKHFNSVGFDIYGDPETDIWTQIPEHKLQISLDLQNDKVFVYYGGNGGKMVPVRANLCYLDQNNRYHYGTTGADGLFLLTKGMKISSIAATKEGKYLPARYEVISSNQTISSTKELYHNILITNGSTLTISGNASLKMAPNTGIVVQSKAALHIKGSASSDIGLSGSVAKHRWNGITAKSGSIISITNCSIKDAKKAFSGTPASLSFDNVSVVNCTNGVEVAKSEIVSITNSTFTGTYQGCGITLVHSPADISGNTICNFHIGIKAISSSPLIYRNTIKNNVATGIYAEGRNSCTYLVFPGLHGVQELNNAIYHNGLLQSDKQTHSNSQIYIGAFGQIYLNNGHNNIYYENNSFPEFPLIVKGGLSQWKSISAHNNYWGSTKVNDSFFYPNPAYWIKYSGFSHKAYLKNSGSTITPSLKEEGRILNEGYKAVADKQYSLAKTKYIDLIDHYSGTEEAGFALANLNKLYSKAGWNHDDLFNLYEKLKLDSLWNKRLVSEVSFKSALLSGNYSTAENILYQIKQVDSTSIDKQLTTIDSLILLESINNSTAGSKTGVSFLQIESIFDKLDKHLEVLELGKTKEKQNAGILPNGFLLQQNYPNPFNPSTTINYQLEDHEFVNITVFNTKGELIWQTGNKQITKGRHSVHFDGSKFNSGVYFYSLEIGGKVMQTNKMILIK